MSASACFCSIIAGTERQLRPHLTGSPFGRFAMSTAESISLCPICGNHVHKASRGFERKFCSRKCSQLAGSRAQNERLKIVADEARPMVPCPICGTKFKQKYRRMYCSDKCQEKARRESPQRKAYVAQYRERTIEHDRARAREYMRNRLATDPEFKTRHLRSSGRRREIVIARDDNTAKLVCIIQRKEDLSILRNQYYKRKRCC